jgi:hypothetical protein
MAGQPPDGTWQSKAFNGQAAPNGQDQVRMAWQAPPPHEQPAYESYPAPPSPQSSFQQGGQAYGADAESDEHRTMAWEQPPVPPTSWDQPGGQRAGWHSAAEFPAPGQTGHAAYSVPGNAAYQAPRQRAANHSKGFLASLFDFGFNSFVTPKVVKGLYALAAVWTIFVAIFLLLVAINFGGANVGTVLFSLVGIAVFGLLSLGTIRVFLELFMALHRINENIQVLRDRGDEN